MSRWSYSQVESRRTKHDSARAVVGIEEGDAEMVSRLKLEDCRSFEGQWFLMSEDTDQGEFREGFSLLAVFSDACKSGCGPRGCLWHS